MELMVNIGFDYYYHRILLTPKVMMMMSMARCSSSEDAGFCIIYREVVVTYHYQYQCVSLGTSEYVDHGPMMFLLLIKLILKASTVLE